MGYDCVGHFETLSSSSSLLSDLISSPAVVLETVRLLNESRSNFLQQ